MECSQPYRVEGEIGRIDFVTYEVPMWRTGVWSLASSESDPTAFAALGPREYYRASNFRERWLPFAGALSMRDMTNMLQRIRHAAPS